MSNISRAAQKSNVTGHFSSGVNKWSGSNLQNDLLNQADSTEWTDPRYVITFSSSFNYDCSANGSYQAITLTANATMAIVNAVVGREYKLEVYQDGTGGRTLTLPTPKLSNGVSLSTSANSLTIIAFYFDGTNYIFSLGQYA
jgi:hypothetical protein